MLSTLWHNFQQKEKEEECAREIVEIYLITASFVHLLANATQTHIQAHKICQCELFPLFFLLLYTKSFVFVKIAFVGVER